MSHKSLPSLNKLNTSMIWYTTFYYKNYCWLSSQYLYFLYFFNKLLNYLDFFFTNLFWVTFQSSDLAMKTRSYKILPLHYTRFSKPITSYMVNVHKHLVVYNLFYHTTLENLQALSNPQVVPESPYNNLYMNSQIVEKLFYLD